ncbi:MAG: IS1595 family transposase [Candidatus Gastranaerophilales bacterium]|nr:IS1595 family transposase [Candidatus Gastranaerophilales bacterium]
MFKYSKISQYKIKKILFYFSQDLTATQTAKIMKLNRKTINKYYQLFREKILQSCESENGFEGELELDESYFGGKHHKGKRGRGSENKIPVFGILKRNGKVYTQIIPNSSSETLLDIVQNKIKLDSVVYTDSFRAYNKLSISGYKHYRINHSKEFARGKNHINGIESFWGYCKMRLAKFYGLKKEEFLLHLKESEFRFNNRNKDLYKMMFQAITES